MVNRGLKTQRWFVTWDCLTHVEDASHCNDQAKGRWAGRSSSAMSVSVNQMKITPSFKWSKLIFTSMKKFVSSKFVIRGKSECE